MTVKQLLFSLIASVICENKEQMQIQYKPKEEQLAKLYRLSKAHDVAHIVCEALERCGLLENGEYAQKFKKQKHIAIYTVEQKKYDYAEICKTIDEAGFDFIPLKGSLLRDMYPESWMRTSCDIDILVKKEDCEKVCKVLTEKSGFVLKSGKTLHDIQLISPTGVLFELHYTLIEDDCLPKAAVFFKDVWSTAERCRDFKHMYAMTNELFYLYHLAHMAKHVVHGGCGIKSFIDLYIIENKLCFDREKLNDLFEKAQLLTFYNQAKQLSMAWFENEPYSDTGREFERYVLNGGVYGTASNDAAMSAGKGESKFKSLMKNTFLTYDALCVIYPDLKKRKVLFPFYQIKRWFRVFDKKKRKKIMDLTTIRNRVSDEKQDLAKSLLLNLGIEQ